MRNGRPRAGTRGKKLREPDRATEYQLEPDGSVVVTLGSTRERRSAGIGDRVALIELFQRMADRHGGKRQAAAALDTSLAQFNRLLNPDHPAQHLNSDLYGQLRRQVGLREAALFHRALLVDEAENELRAYRTWLQESLSPWGLAINSIEPWTEPRIFVPWRDIRAWKVLEPLYASLALRSHLVAFEREIVALGFGTAVELEAWRDRRKVMSAQALQYFLTARGLLAILRIVEPLISGPGIELRLSELEHDPARLLPFLKASIARERALLKRAPALQRAQAIAEAVGRSRKPAKKPARARKAR
jgi:hypothetical protein